jgi:hypothetical protein
MSYAPTSHIRCIDPRLPQAPESSAVSGSYASNADGTGNLGPNPIAVIAPSQGNLSDMEASAGNTNPVIFMVAGIESQYPITP